MHHCMCVVTILFVEQCSLLYRWHIQRTIKQVQMREKEGCIYVHL